MANCLLVILLTINLYAITHTNGALTTQTVNAAFMKRVAAERTCGSPSEKYYKVSENDNVPRQRKISVCDASNASLAHNASYLVDGKLATYWQSTAMVMRGNITIDLTGSIHKYYFIKGVEIYFEEFFRPLQMAIYKSKDNGATYQPWQFYVTSDSSHIEPADQCSQKFNMTLGTKPAFVNDVICEAYPNVTMKAIDDIVTWNPAYLRGELTSPSQAFVDWLNVTNIRIVFTELNRPFDPMAVRFYHYAVREVYLEAYCPCNGHGISCKYNNNPAVKDNQCVCQPGTCGNKCDKCCDAFNQFPWKHGGKGPMIVDEAAACQPCNCHNHSSVCVYNQTVANNKQSLTVDGKYNGGGVCQNCEHNTTGVNCEQCQTFFYRPANRSKYADNVCEECGCSAIGCRNTTTEGIKFLDCQKHTNAFLNHIAGECYCKENVMGRICDRCKPGFYNLSISNPVGCQVCKCDQAGSVNRTNVCEPDEDGQCPCKPNVHGIRCETCNDTYYGLTHDDPMGCKACMCNCGGSKNFVCNKKSGQCVCLENVTGRQCERSKDKAYYPDLHFMSNHQESKESPWLATISIMKGVSTVSGLFNLLFSYQSNSRQTVTVTITNSNITTTKSVTLHTCNASCIKNLSEFGEMSLSGMVTVNVTFSPGFQGKKIVALPKEFYEATGLCENRDMFLTNCSVLTNDVRNGTSMEQFCKQSVFTITTGYLGKALDCNCNPNGSYNLVCEKYGGQCSCKPGVTGRKCDQCIPGYYNFNSSGCTACGCTTDNKVCNPVTGQCVCPPNTKGRVCDSCNHTYWGWNATTGCQACKCDVTGSSNLQCNLTTGICSCKVGVHLDKCSECQDNYKNFSSQGCSLCSCDMRGSLNPVCNKTTGQCPCKTNSVSMLCNQCKAGSFYMYQPNPKGCTDCICMGITNNCSSTTKHIYQRSLVSSLWELYDEDNKTSIPVETSVMAMDSENIDFLTANVSSSLQQLIWKAKINLTTRSLVSSYGGNLSFALHVTNLSGAVAIANPKVIIKGEKGISIEQRFESIPKDQVTTRAVFMKETSWFVAGTNNTVSRQQFMLVLAKPLAMHVTASLLSGDDSYYKISFGGVGVSDVQDNTTMQGRAVDVEQCDCGHEYTGLSCERCAPSHHRVNVTGDSYFGKCSRCNCYSHTPDCHADTGYCYNCNHNTTGNHCELCLDGFYGNATNGTPNDCMTCPCEAPKTTTSLCTDFYGKPKCTNCSEGYEGLQCDKCKIKYFGKPHLKGGNCSLCQCNNNSDVCDTLSGECQACKYNTTGFHCERCENETYGYALVQNCTACACNSTGSKSKVCNHRTGQCECQPNVDSRDCSTCMFKSYNFTSTGCTECKCNKHGSSNLQCNETGLCECNAHALGDKCDRCETNYFGLPHASCKACDCNSTGSNTSVPCDGVTGQCHCKFGVTGRQCDRCMVMHHNFSSSGCTPCDNCTRITLQGRLNDTQKSIITSLEKGTQVEKLRPFKQKLTELENKIKTTEGLVTEFNKRVADLQDGLKILKSNTLNSSIHSLQNRLSSLMTYANQIKLNTTQALEKVQRIKNNTEDAMTVVKDVNKSTTSIVNDLNTLKNSAIHMLSMTNTTLQSTYTDESTRTNRELASAKHVREVLVMYARGNVTQHSTLSTTLITTVVQDRKSLNNKLDEFGGLSQRNDAITRLNQEVKILVQQTLSLIARSTIALTNAQKLLDQGKSPLSSAWSDISHGQSSYKNTELIVAGNTGLTAKLTSLKTTIKHAQSLVSSTNRSVYINGTLHAANLTAEANLRKSELDSVQDNAKRAVDAIKQYESVVKLVNQSLETSVKVNESLHQTMKVLNDFSKSLNVMEKSAQDTLKMSQELLNKTLTRNTDIAGLQNKVATANKTITGTISAGTQMDHYYNILLSKSNKLTELSEPHAAEHSIISSTKSAESWVELVNRQWESIFTYAAAVQQEVNRLNTSMASINSNAEHASTLMPQGFQAATRTTVALQNLTESVNLAAIEKNKTTVLQTQLTSNMKRLQDKLQQAKTKIAKIQHALRLQGKTSLQYTPMGRVAQKTAFSDVSFDIKADSIQGPLLYIAEKNTDLDNQVSLSLGLVRGEFVKFTYNLGSGPISIINYETPIRRGYWYRVYASRLKERARLSVTNYASNETSTYESASNLILPFKVTNFTSDSPMFIGSLPDGAMINMTQRYFSGCIDNVVINQQPINLWQPAKVAGNRSVCSKCLDSASTPGFYDITSGTSFYGNPNTYIIQRMGGFDISRKSEMVFHFRTFQNVTSIMNVRGDADYMYGVYISSGRVFFYFKNGATTHTLSSNKTSYNDGRWYEVHVMRGLTNSTLTVKDIGSGSDDTSLLMLNSSLTLAAGREMVFGGRNPKSNFNAPISGQFAGALRNISLSTASGDLKTRLLNNNTLLEGSSQVSFCGVLKVVEPCIRFIGDSYAALNTGIKTVNVFSFKFKTLNPSGVLAYGYDASMNYYFYLALFHGNLYLVATNTTKNAEASYTTVETLNRGEYHTVHIAIVNSRLRVMLNTRSTPVITIPTSGPIRINGSLYIGSLPASHKVPFDVPVVDSFVGGMRDIQINNRAQDIFSGTASQVSLAGCTPEQNVIPTPKPTNPPPTQPPPTCGSRYPSLQLSTAANQVRLGPAQSYIGFNLTREVLDYLLFQHVITITFRSLSPHGILFYAADNLKSPSSFMSIELVNGRLVFKFNFGQGLVRVQSKLNSYGSTGDWYTVHFVRISNFGALLVSTINDYNNNRVNKTQPLVLNSPVYYGGVPTGINTSMLESKKSNGDPINFYGCLANMDITSANRTQIKKLNPRKDADAAYSTKGNASCYKNAKPQASFNGRSYIKLYENYKLPNLLDVSLSFRTYIRTGLLLIWTNKTGPGALTMEQLQGQIVLTFTSETNKTVLRWTDPDIPAQGQYNASYKLCDNNIHTIRLQRGQSTIKIEVDNHREESFTIQDGFQLDGDLFIGGIPDGAGFTSHTGLSKRRFEGCVQSLKIASKQIDLVRDPVSQEQIQPVCRGK